MCRWDSKASTVMSYPKLAAVCGPPASVLRAKRAAFVNEVNKPRAEQF